jgi:hypothetical protein
MATEKIKTAFMRFANIVAWSIVIGLQLASVELFIEDGFRGTIALSASILLLYTYWDLSRGITNEMISLFEDGDSVFFSSKEAGGKRCQ